MRKLISDLDVTSSIEPRDSNQQYYIKLSPPAYEILIANMVDFGGQWGLSIKAGEIDSKGTNTGARYNMELLTRNGLQAQVSVNCYNTKSGIHIQLNKGTKACQGWKDKVDCLSHFVNKTLAGAIKQIERSEDFSQLKTQMRTDLTRAKAQLPDGGSEQCYIKALPSSASSSSSTEQNGIPTLATKHTSNVECEVQEVLHSETINTQEGSADSCLLEKSKKSMDSQLFEKSKNCANLQTPEKSKKSAAPQLLGKYKSVHSTCATTESKCDPKLPFSNDIIDSTVELDPLTSDTIEASPPAIKDIESHRTATYPSIEENGHQGQHYQTLNNLRITIKARNDEINQLKSEVKLNGKVRQDLADKNREVEEKVEKIAKIMKNNERLGMTIEALKGDILAMETNVKAHQDTIEQQKEIISKQGKTIDDLSIRTECNKDVAVMFMNEVLDENSDSVDLDEKSDDASKERVAKLFKELQEEREKFDQIVLAKKEDESEIASLKLLIEDEQDKKKCELGKKEKEIKSLKAEIKRLEAVQLDMSERNKTSAREMFDLNEKLESMTKENQSLVSQLLNLEKELENLKMEFVNSKVPGTDDLT